MNTNILSLEYYNYVEFEIGAHKKIAKTYRRYGYGKWFEILGDVIIKIEDEKDLIQLEKSYMEYMDMKNIEYLKKGNIELYKELQKEVNE